MSIERRKTCVLGLGYMGLPTALLFSKNGIEVIGYDTDTRKTALLQKGELPFEEKGLLELHREGRRNFEVIAKLTSEALEHVSSYVVCVPTPFNPDKSCDLKYVKSAVESLMPFLKKNDLLIIEATVTPGTTKNIVATWLKQAGFDPSTDINLVYVSEKAIPGNTIHEMVHNDRIIGGYTPKAAELTQTLYSSFVTAAIHVTDTTTAEAVKVVENSFRDINIAFANELVKICNSFDVSVWEVIALANKHPRVNILSPGPGVGGHCIAVDPWFLYEKFPSELVLAARNVNDAMPAYVIENLKALMSNQKITEPRVGILGVAYKKNVDDCRDAPSEVLFQLCEKQGWQVFAHDPFVKNFQYPLIENIEEMKDRCNVFLLAVDHDFYLDVDFGLMPLLDTRNMKLRSSNCQLLGRDV
jgi:UDP-N-acetyl-D-mannosaminuronic acid dehydrogenase